MAVTTTVEWNGVQATADLLKQLDVGLLRAGIRVQTSAILRAPVDTGNLRNSIAVASNLKSGTSRDNATGRSATLRPKSGVALVGTIVEYAEYVEFGTARTPQQAFLGPALESNNENILAELKKAMRKSRFIG